MTSDADVDAIPVVKRSFEVDCCGGTVRLHPQSMLISEEGWGETRWTHQYLGSCPHCDDAYPWMRPLATVDS